MDEQVRAKQWVQRDVEYVRLARGQDARNVAQLERSVHQARERGEPSLAAIRLDLLRQLDPARAPLR